MFKLITATYLILDQSRDLGGSISRLSHCGVAPEPIGNGGVSERDVFPSLSQVVFFLPYSRCLFRLPDARVLAVAALMVGKNVSRTTDRVGEVSHG